MKPLKQNLIVLLLIFTLFTCSGCTGKKTSEDTPPQTTDEQTTAVQTTQATTQPEPNACEIIWEYSARFDEKTKDKISPEFLNWLDKTYGDKVMNNIAVRLLDNSFTPQTWHELTSCTFHVLWDYYNTAENAESADNCKKMPDSADGSTVINLVGDVSLADNWYIMPQYDERGKGVYGILSEEAVREMQNASVMLVNSEFAFSSRGEALEKQYTFRGAPERVEIYNELGIDIVSLANNHIYDFGSQAFNDTLNTLADADIPYIGAGKNIDEARRPYYFIVNGRKIAFVAATRAEKYIITPEATADSEGVLRAYDPAMFIETIKEAKENSDYVIAYIHWGTENSHGLEDVQRDTGRDYIDAGADIVVGAHAHVLQGIEFYNGKPIVYNLGNFIFNGSTIDTGMLKIHIDSQGNPTYEFLTCLQKGCYTAVVDGSERERILSLMNDISYGVKFDENGFFTENKDE